MPWSPAGQPDELPTLRASLRLGDKVEGSNVSLSFYDVKFYPYTEPGVDPVFALVGSNTVWVCRPKNDAKTAIEVLRCFKDEEITDQDLDAREHQLNSICWSKDAATGDPLVIVANDERKIKILNVKTGKLVRTLIGHGSAVNDLIICPTNPDILASCSMDYTIRIWNISTAFASQPCVALCAGEGHREGLLGIAWHRSGRYLLSGGHDTVVCLWAVPDLPRSPTDHIAKVFHPHFASNELHWNYVDCLQWYGDLILSRAVGEPTSSRGAGRATGSIFLWQIDGFEPDRYAHGDAQQGEHTTPLPPAPGPSVYKPSFTRSAFGKGATRLLTFELKFSSLFYMRFGLFHQPGQRPILAAGNERSKVHFWDLQQLEEGAPPQPPPPWTQRWAGHVKRSARDSSLATDTAAAGNSASGASDRASMAPTDDLDRDERAAGTRRDDDGNNEDNDKQDDDHNDDAGFRRPPARARKPHQQQHPLLPHDALQDAQSNRASSIASDHTGSHLAEHTTAASSSAAATTTRRGNAKPGRKPKDDPRLRYAIDDPFRELQPHKAIVVPKVGFCVRQVAWSVGGEWCVACGDNGMVALFSRWMKEP